MDGLLVNVEKALLEEELLNAVRGRKDTTAALRDNTLSPALRAEFQEMKAEFIRRENAAREALADLRERVGA